MEELFFVGLVLGGVLTLLFVVNRSKPAESGQSDATRGDPLSASPHITPTGPTPGNNVLSHNRQVWNTRRKRLRTPNHRASSAFNAGFEDEPEYDGYSRRDRRHLTPAHIRDDETEYRPVPGRIVEKHLQEKPTRPKAGD